METRLRASPEYANMNSVNCHGTNKEVEMKSIGLAAALVCAAIFPAFAQDPVKLRPKQYMVEAENNLVRIVRVKREPHEEAPMHEHPAAIVIFLKDMHQKITSPDGKVIEARRNANEVNFNKPNKHAEESIDSPMESLIVELKPGETEGSPAPPIPAELDPAKVDPKHVKVEIDNEFVRVLRLTRGPHEGTPLHAHPYYVAVFLSDVHQTVTEADGTPHDVNRKRGEFAFNKPNKHSEKNNADQTAETLIVELKKGSLGQ
jgi:hypothetical protein